MFCNILSFIIVNSVLLISIDSYRIGREQSRVPCRNDDMCVEVLPGSKCVDWLCHCEDPENCKLNENKVFANEIGKPCLTHPECLVENSYCDDEKNVCECNVGFHASDDKRTCVENEKHPRSSPKISCWSDDMCREILPGSDCVDSFCKCNDTKKNGCKKNTNPRGFVVGKGCSKAICHIQHAECNMFSDVADRCDCMLGYEPTVDKKRCVRSLGASCKDDSDCEMEFSICKDRLCDCVDGMHGIDGVCYETKQLKENCASEKECYPSNSDCVNGTCVCKSEHVPFRNACVEPSNIDEHCLEDIQCVASLGDDSYCRENFCSCKKGFEFHKELNKCIRSGALHKKCKVNKDCSTNAEDAEHVICVENECYCKPPLVVIDDKCICESSATRILNASLFLYVLSIIANLF